MIKKKIISELRNVLKKNSTIHDIWLYGSIDDKISDLDLLIVYKKKPEKINLPFFLKKMVADGTIIYIPRNIAKDIFLFEDLRVYSIRYKKKIITVLSKKIIKFRSLTSFLERYYERRIKLANIKSISAEAFRIIKSVIFSYDNFYKYLGKNIKFKIKEEYRKFRKEFSEDKIKKNKLDEYLKKFKKNDDIFYTNSIKILNQLYPQEKNNFLRYKFNNYVKYSFDKKKNHIIVPYILGYIYKFYSSEKISISKKIKSDFESNIKIYKKNKYFNNYLKRKINFINVAYKDLKKAKFENGLYRLTWYLSN